MLYTTVPSFVVALAVLSSRADAEPYRRCVRRTLRRFAARRFPHYAVAAAGTRGDGVDRAETSGHRDAFLRRGLRLRRHAAGAARTGGGNGVEGLNFVGIQRRADELFRAYGAGDRSPQSTNWWPRAAWPVCSIPYGSSSAPCAFGGVMTGSGMLGALTAVFPKFVRRTFSAVASTQGAAIFFNLCTADQHPRSSFRAVCSGNSMPNGAGIPSAEPFGRGFGDGLFGVVLELVRA